MGKSKTNKRFQIELIFDGDAVDAVCASCRPIQNIKHWCSLSWISAQRGWDPDSPAIFAITYLAYIIFDRIDLLLDRADFLHHKMPKLPNKKTVEKLRYLFSPTKELLKISSGLKMKNFNNLKDGMTDTVIFKKGKDLQFNVDMTFMKNHWQVTRIQLLKA